MAIVMGIIGYGGMAGYHQNDFCSKIPEITIKGIYDVLDSAQEKAKEQGLVVYESADAMLADPEISLVLVATPNNFHKDYSIAAMRAGKNVLCEKPVTMNAAELEEIIAVQKETGKLFTVHQNRRWDKDFCTVRKILDTGMIGKPYFIESRVLGSRRAMHGWRGHRVNGGGMLLDWGVHLMDQALAAIDSPVVSVDAHLQCVFSDEVDDSIKVLLRFENGVSYLMEMSTNCLVLQPRWHVSCTDGTAMIENWDCDGKVVTLREDGPMQWDDDIVFTSAGPTRTMAPRPAHTTEVLPLPDPELEELYFYKNLVKVLTKGAQPVVTTEQALRVMKVIDLAFESDRDHCGKACHI